MGGTPQTNGMGVPHLLTASKIIYFLYRQSRALARTFFLANIAGRGETFL